MPSQGRATDARRERARPAPVIAWLLLGLPLLAAVLILALEVRHQHLVAADNSLERFDRIERGLPWGGYPWRVMARSAAALWTRDPAQSARILDRTADRYPMESAQWLAQARIEAAGAGDHARMAAYLELAVAVQPSDRAVLWEAAQLAIQAGAHDAAEGLLRRWLASHPEDTRQALFVAGRWQPDPDQLVGRLLPDDDQHRAQAMAHAVHRKDLALAEAVMRQAPAPRDPSDPVFRGLVSLLLERDEVGRAAALWAGVDRHYDGEGVANGSFDRELVTAGALEWHHAGMPQGAAMARDRDRYHDPPASLRVHFDGSANVVLRRRGQIQVPVQPGARYRLFGHWRGQALTTRTLPYLYIDAGVGALRLPVPGRDFDWTPWAGEVQVGESTRLLTLAVRRDRSNSFDNRISGDLWLDAIGMQRLDDGSGARGDTVVDSAVDAGAPADREAVR